MKELKTAKDHPNLKITIKENGVGYPEEGLPVDLNSRDALLNYLQTNLIK